MFNWKITQIMMLYYLLSCIMWMWGGADLPAFG